jgi:hypothetical protein
MEALERGARMIVWFVASGLLLWSFMDLSLYLFVRIHNDQAIEVLPCITNSLPMLAGIVILIKTKAITRWVCDKLE